MLIKNIRLKMNEDVIIPTELSTPYLSVKKQIVDKQTRKDQLMKAVNQVDNEINILSKNLLAIETKAAQMQGQEVQQTEKGREEEGGEKATVEVEGKVKESLDEKWKKYIVESINEDEPDIDVFTDDIENDVEGEILIDEPLEEPEGESLEGDYVFILRIIDEDEPDDIIAKFYKDEDDDFWKVRVVQGSEEPLETMQFDPEMQMLEIIEHVGAMFDEVEQMSIEEYQELLDDKEIKDEIFYDDIIEENDVMKKSQKD